MQLRVLVLLAAAVAAGLAAPTTPASAAAAPPVGGSITAPGGLAPGQSLVDPSGRIQLVLQTDGNLVQRTDVHVDWTSHTTGHPGARLSVQTDGNVVLRGTDGRALWNTGTGGIGAGVRFGLSSNGDLGVTSASGRVAWSNFTNRPVFLERLTAGGYAFKGQALFSNPEGGRPGDLYTFEVGGDGRVVARTVFRGVLWATRTAGHPNAYLTLQTDGNLVVRAPNGTTLWANGVRGVSGATLAMQGDGNVVERDARGRAIWSTRTHA